MEKKIIFLHIPKTAGTSLRDIVEKEYPEKCLSVYPPWPYQPEVLAEEIKARLPSVKVLYGHVLFGLHHHLNIDAQYITFLRNPIERVNSFFNHSAYHSHAGYYKAIQNGLSLLQLLESEQVLQQTNNMITRMLAAYHTNNLLDDERVLEQALENIDKHFCVVGLMEKFAESVNLLGKKLDWQSAYEIPYLNVVAKKHIQEVDAQTQAALEKYNRLDILLYEHVSKNFSSVT
ncbi:sulfotransferase family 2 domain-containing protein [Candidatus Halobeggiatoa sp. HSG11]|nr:sulfotransferase family 2 domain-containing protein [Candidatus Halobeggiatoa sp. HSG11]